MNYRGRPPSDSGRCTCPRQRQRQRQRQLRRWRWIRAILSVGVAVSLLLGLGVGLAEAFIGSSGSGTSSGTVGTFTAAAISAPSVKGGASPYPTITWTSPATTVASSYEPTVKYVVDRCSTTTSTPCTPTTPIASGTCHGALAQTTTSCVDTSAVANADDTYKVVAVSPHRVVEEDVEHGDHARRHDPTGVEHIPARQRDRRGQVLDAPASNASGTVYFDPTVAGSITVEYTVTDPAISSTLAGSGPASGAPAWLNGAQAEPPQQSQSPSAATRQTKPSPASTSTRTPTPLAPPRRASIQVSWAPT